MSVYTFAVQVLEEVAQRRHLRRRFAGLPSATNRVLCSDLAWITTLLRTNEIDLTDKTMAHAGR